MTFQPVRFGAASAALAFLLAPLAHATTPPSSTVTVPTTPGDVVVTEWTGTSPAGAAGGGSTCASTGVPDPTEDAHAITINVPAGAYDAVTVRADFHVEWTNGSDLVLTVERGTTHLDDSDGGTPEENITITNPVAGQYAAVVCSFLATANTPFSGRLTLTAIGPPPPDGDGDGVLNEVDVCPGTPSGVPVDVDGCPAPGASGLSPRFEIHVAPPALGNEAAEPSIGYNRHSQRTMFISYTQALRQTYQENIVPQVLPASCPALWEDKSGLLTTVNSLDPILFTDEVTGRTFNSQLTGSNSAFEYTDNDGENWTPGQIAASNGGADHQTVASGPYPATETPPTASWPATGAKRAVYYCSQSVATAFCARSDDGGQTFGPGITFKNLDCAAGALHGHVKVAPDGTVYVPDSSQCVLEVGGTAGKVIVHRSVDAGATWTTHAIESSEGGAGSDPSVGIATDGTLYMCYENSDSTVHMAVSHDRGETWEKDVDLGLPHGIVQTRFPQAVAGDGNRAACAFLGTTTPGNGASLEFQGVWHGYIATTYDGGDSYHLVNVTPLDPVQGWGGVGPSGTNRNLLDFNDLQIDDQGRLLFALADGCTGPCVTDPSQNAFEAKATIVRQSGGRTMFARFDSTAGTADARPRYNVSAPIAPAEACARQDLSTRNLVWADIAWTAPDTGGSRITNYEVHRAESAAGPFTFLADAGTATTYRDGTVSPQVEKYYYQVVAENAQGAALASNTIELVVSLDGNSCELPGILSVADPEGDSTTGAEAHDIQSVFFAEPADHAGKLVATLKVADLATLPPNTIWVVRFDAPTDPANGELGYFVGFSTADGEERFVHGTYRVDQVQLTSVSVYTVQGDIDPASSWDADGTITLVADKSLFGSPAIGNNLTGVVARVGPLSSNSSPIAGGAQDDTGTGFYTIRGSDVCVPPAVVLAELKASTLEGVAPLDVVFTISGTAPAGDTLESFTLLFGDETGASPAPYVGTFDGAGSVQVTHRYLAEGVYRARLQVRDSAGRVSGNLAEQTITILTQPRDVTQQGNNRLGGALSWLTLLVLAGVALARRR